MPVPTDAEKATFAESAYRIQPVSGPLLLSTIEPSEQVSQASTLAAEAGEFSAEMAKQFWFDSDFLYHLLALASDPFVENALALRIIHTRLLLGAVHVGVGPPRSVRLRKAVIPAGVVLPMATGRVAELPFWEFGGAGGNTGRNGATRVALQYLVHAADIEPYCLARSLHWIDLRPGKDNLRRAAVPPAPD